MKPFRLGLIINPLAGLGGSVSLKGSDGVALEAIAKGAEPKAQLRMAQALEVLLPYQDRIEIVTASGAMGESLAKSLGFNTHVAFTLTDEHAKPHASTANDTQAAAKILLDASLDLLLFAGGMAPRAISSAWLMMPCPYLACLQG